jgi:hypothetical protein
MLGHPLDGAGRTKNLRLFPSFERLADKPGRRDQTDADEKLREPAERRTRPDLLERPRQFFIAGHEGIGTRRRYTVA